MAVYRGKCVGGDGEYAVSVAADVAPDRKCPWCGGAVKLYPFDDNPAVKVRRRGHSGRKVRKDAGSV